MLIDTITLYCHNKYQSKEEHCPNCTYKQYCKGRCDKCLHYIHTPTAAPAPRKYDCPNMANFYTCKYSYKYMSELEYALVHLKDLKDKDNLKIMSIGCGPCTDLFALDYLSEKEIFKFKTIEYRGIDLAQNVWGEIHNQIQIYNPSKYHVTFFYQDITELIDEIINGSWAPDLIVFQYVFSDMQKHCEATKLNSFISKIAQFINIDMNENTYIILNDINLSTAMGGGREHFDKLASQISQMDCRRYHFNNSNKSKHFEYGAEYDQNNLILKNPSYLNFYEPYTSCASAQLIIKKVNK